MAARNSVGIKFFLSGTNENIYVTYSLTRVVERIDLRRIRIIFADALQEVFYPLGIGLQAIDTSNGYEYLDPERLRPNQFESTARINHGRFKAEQIHRLGEELAKRLNAVGEYEAVRVRQLSQLFKL